MKNVAILNGTVTREFVFCYTKGKENFYRAFLSVQRLSGTYDTIPILASDNIVSMGKFWGGKRVCVIGSVRAYSTYDKKTKVFVEADRIVEIEEQDKNEVRVEGHVTKPPKLRETLKGSKVSDVIIGVNYLYRKTDFIPCILWGKNAVEAEKLEVGTKVKLSGRLQSRKYNKKISEQMEEERTVYEVSVARAEYGEG